jgi:hypothetical protein
MRKLRRVQVAFKEANELIPIFLKNIDGKAR